MKENIGLKYMKPCIRYFFSFGQNVWRNDSFRRMNSGASAYHSMSCLTEQNCPCPAVQEAQGKYVSFLPSFSSISQFKRLSIHIRQWFPHLLSPLQKVALSARTNCLGTPNVINFAVKFNYPNSNSC